jgi:hypothetical protein
MSSRSCLSRPCSNTGSEVPPRTVSNLRLVAPSTLDLSTAVAELSTIMILLPKRAGLLRSLARRVRGVNPALRLLGGIVVIEDVDKCTARKIGAVGEAD